MKKTTRRVPTRFAPVTRFKLKPAPTPEARAVLNQQIEALKHRLLVAELHAASDAQVAFALQRAANEAAALAWLTAYPLLVLPELLTEKAVHARKQTAKQAQITRRTRSWMALAA